MQSAAFRMDVSTASDMPCKDICSAARGRRRRRKSSLIISRGSGNHSRGTMSPMPSHGFAETLCNARRRRRLRPALQITVVCLPLSAFSRSSGTKTQRESSPLGSPRLSTCRNFAKNSLERTCALRVVAICQLGIQFRHRSVSRTVPRGRSGERCGSCGSRELAQEAV